MRLLRTLLLTVLFLAAARMAGRALRRENEVITALWTLIAVTAAVQVRSTASTPKARSTAERMNAVVAAAGTLTANVTAAQAAATAAQAAANAAQATASGALPAAGGTVTGSLTVTGNLTVNGVITGPGGNLTVGNDLIVGGGIETNGTIVSGFDVHAANALYVDDIRIIPGQTNATSPGGAPDTGDYTNAWGESVNNALNELIGIMSASGIA